MSYYNYTSMSPDFCGLETRQMTAQDYWNFTTLETGEYFDKKIDTKTMFKNNVYLTDDQGDAVLRLGSLLKIKCDKRSGALIFLKNRKHEIIIFVLF